MPLSSAQQPSFSSAVVMAVVAAFQVANNQQQLDELNNLHNVLNRARSNPPDLLAFATDSNPLGSFKLTQTLVSQTVPDVPSTAALPAHQATDPVFVITPRGATPKASDSFTYGDWNQVAWQAETSGGWFKQACLGDSSGQNCPQRDSFIASIQYVDWLGAKRIASRLGSNFVIIKGEPAASDKACPADSRTGVTPATDFSQCSTYVASEFQYTYQGNAFSMRLSHPPVFTSDKTIPFTWQGPQQQVAVTAVGTPAPAISLASGSSLPAGVTFQGSNVRGNGNAQFNFAGSSSGTRATYHVTLLAQNAESPITQDFTIEIVSKLAIASPAGLTVDYRQQVSFLVTTTGELPMKLSMDPIVLLPGLTFHDNGNGTATISGSATAITNRFSGCITVDGKTTCTGITATNAQGSVTQLFSSVVNPPPEPQITLPAATFIAGTPNSFKVTTTGATTPVGFVFGPGDLSWLDFHDNENGTCVLSGTPPAGTTGSFTAYLYAYAKVNGLICCPSKSPFTINVLGQPVFLSPNLARFSVGDPSSFTISTNQPTGSISEIGALPQGLEFTNNGNGTATISGTPAAGAGGSQTLQLSVTAAAAGTQELTLQVNEAPRFTTPTWANFYAGQENSFAVVVAGYPSLSSAPVSQSQSAADFVAGMEFTVAGLPADLSFSNLNPEGYNTGTLRLNGTPSSSDVGKHVITLSASNGVAAVKQTFTLNIAAVLGDVNGDGVVSCTDLDLVKASLDKYRGEAGYNPAADITNDGVVNVKDLALVARNVPNGTVCR